MRIVKYFFKHHWSIVLLGLMSLFSAAVQAELTIEITKGIESAIPVAVVPFGGDAPVDMAQVINADLSRSGYFKLLAEQNMLSKPATPEAVDFNTWKALGQEYMVIGQVLPGADGYNVQFYLYSVAGGQQLLGYRITPKAQDLRRAAHYISDLVFEKLTGIKGMFSGRIAYITSVDNGAGKKTYTLQVADADGYDPQTIAASQEPLMSPTWSPDGTKVAYVSFENKTAQIYIQTLATGERQMVSGSRGINGAPSWSPDGTRLALTLSKDGNPEIYVLNVASRSLRRLTNNSAIDTEPTWSPDGQHIVFTSDRGGKPQLYLISASGGGEQRLTFEGSYNARGVFSPDGKMIALVHGNGGGYRIAVMDMATRSISVLTDGPLDESPSFSPNGSMILYASDKGGRQTLASVSTDGRTSQQLGIQRGEVRDPAWSP
ncbi:MAG: Tol-Pal system beta propeller repeat protein TolB [Gammaproteobacteria bacterium]